MVVSDHPEWFKLYLTNCAAARSLHKWSVAAILEFIFPGFTQFWKVEIDLFQNLHHTDFAT